MSRVLGRNTPGAHMGPNPARTKRHFDELFEV